MNVYIGTDHNGFELKELLKKWLVENGYQIEDCGNTVLDPADDYPDYASRVAERVKNNPKDNRGILLCGSGIGVDIVANKYPGIRCGLGINAAHVSHARTNDDINILSLPAQHISSEEAIELVKIFLETEFSFEERHERRKKKIEEIEAKLRS